MKTPSQEAPTMTPPAAPRLQVRPFDPWDIGQLTLPEPQQAELPEGARAPEGWFTLPPAVRAHLAGLAVMVLAKIGPPPGRVARAASMFDIAWRGSFEPDAVNVSHRDYAAQFYVEDPAAREGWRQSFTAFLRMRHERGSVIRHLLTRLDGAAGVLATLRARHQALGAILAQLEPRLERGGQ